MRIPPSQSGTPSAKAWTSIPDPTRSIVILVGPKSDEGASCRRQECARQRKVQRCRDFEGALIAGEGSHARAQLLDQRRIAAAGATGYDLRPGRQGKCLGDAFRRDDHDQLRRASGTRGVNGVGNEWSAADVTPEFWKTHARRGAGGDQDDGELHRSETQG